MKAQNFLNTEIVTDETRFDIIINSKSFVDFKVIDEKTCIVTLDGRQINHSNLPSISSRTYAISKLSMWKTWAYCSSRMCKFYDANTRMSFTDTDSIYSVTESLRSDLMHTEIHTLKHSPIDYTKSLHAYTMATAYIKTFGPILDFSSLKPKDSLIFKILAENTHTEEEKTSLTNMWNIIGKFTKNKPHLIKHEADCMKNIICASPKQYCITKHPDLSTFPYASNQAAIPLQLKSKGIARSSQMKHLTFFEFHETIVNNKPTEVVSIPALKRLDFRIYLIKTKKKLISKINSKRCFSSLYRKKKHFFSFPLHYKRLQIIV